MLRTECMALAGMNISWPGSGSMIFPSISNSILPPTRMMTSSTECTKSSQACPGGSVHRSHENPRFSQSFEIRSLSTMILGFYMKGNVGSNFCKPQGVVKARNAVGLCVSNRYSPSSRAMRIVSRGSASVTLRLISRKRFAVTFPAGWYWSMMLI